MKIENLKLKILSILFLSSMFLLLNSSNSITYSSMSSGDNWTIQVDDVNINSEPPAAATPKKQITPEKETTTNAYYFNHQKPFSFSISNSIIDHGILSATNPVYRTSNLTISNAENRFIVAMYQDHPLSIKDSDTIIPDTTCDNGSCSEYTSALWENTLTYGFGYRCDNINGNDCPVDFEIKNYYRQFPDNSKNETPQIIISSNWPQETHEIQITYKVNISKTQTTGSYSNSITYITAPGY